MANLDTAPHINDIVGAKREWIKLRKTIDDFIYVDVNDKLRKEIAGNKQSKKSSLANNNLTGKPGAITEISEMPDAV